jgi:hypothetical protein
MATFDGDFARWWRMWPRSFYQMSLLECAAVDEDSVAAPSCLKIKITVWLPGLLVKGFQAKSKGSSCKSLIPKAYYSKLSYVLDNLNIHGELLERAVVQPHPGD